MITKTNKEQTERLRKLGLLPTTYNEHYAGVWTLGDLLDLMPKEINGEEVYSTVYYLQIQYFDGYWFVGYDLSECDLELEDGNGDEFVKSTDLIEALVLAIELLAANGYDFKKK